ncbi:hypothetical protein CARUB_v10027826mg, partial [Capsella rubella]
MRISPTSATNKQIKSSAPNPSLPNDLLLTCFARVSRLYYPTLSLVSKSFQTLVVSPELYKTRSFLNRKENCLYVCLKFPPDPNRYWFTPCRKPNQTLAKKKTTNSSGYALVRFQIHHPPPWNQEREVKYNSLVAVGSDIYIFHASSSSVSILDCRSHMWREAPCMRMKRNYPTVNVVDGKIYVAGGLEMKDFYSSDSSSWMEVFDPNTQSWEPVWCPLSKRINLPYRSAAIEGEIYMVKPNAIGVSYKPKEDKWGDINLKGLEELPKFAISSYIKLVNYGGKMVVLWDKCKPCNEYKNASIWCAVISIERHNTPEIWGKVEWFDAVLAVPFSYGFGE